MPDTHEKAPGVGACTVWSGGKAAKPYLSLPDLMLATAHGKQKLRLLVKAYLCICAWRSSIDRVGMTPASHLRVMALPHNSDQRARDVPLAIVGITL